MPHFSKQENKAKREAEEQAEQILQDKIDRKTSGAPSINAVLAAQFKYGGVFKMNDGEIHYRITIPELGRVIHCHTEVNGTVLTKAHMKPKIKEQPGASTTIGNAAKLGQFTRNAPDEGLVAVHTTYVNDHLNEAVRNKLMKGTYATALQDGALKLQEYEWNFYSKYRNGSFWGAKAERLGNKKVIERIKALSPEILFNLPVYP